MSKFKIIFGFAVFALIGSLMFSNCSNDMMFSADGVASKVGADQVGNANGDGGVAGDDITTSDEDSSCEGTDQEVRNPEVDIVAEYGPNSNHSNRPFESNNSGKYNARHCVLICHIPPGNPDNRRTLRISVAALRAHLANHGDGVISDYAGECRQ